MRRGCACCSARVERPAGRVVRRVDEQHAGLPVSRRAAAPRRSSRQAPSRVGRSDTRVTLRAEDRRLRRQVGPDRHDRHHLVAGADQRLHRQHQRVDAGRRDGDALGADRRMQRRRCSAASPRAARAGRGCARRRSRPRPASACAASRMNCGRGLVALAEPERQHVAAADAGVGDLADLRAGQLVDEPFSWAGPGMTPAVLKFRIPPPHVRCMGRSEAPRPATIRRSRPCSSFLSRRATTVTPQPCASHLVRSHRRSPVRRVARPPRRHGHDRPRHAQPALDVFESDQHTQSAATCRASPTKREGVDRRPSRHAATVAAGRRRSRGRRQGRRACRRCRARGSSALPRTRRIDLRAHLRVAGRSRPRGSTAKLDNGVLTLVLGQGADRRDADAIN